MLGGMRVPTASSSMGQSKQGSISTCHNRLSVTPRTVVHRLLCPWNSPGKNTRVGGHSLLQGIFLMQELNLGLLHCRMILYHLSYQGSP